MGFDFANPGITAEEVQNAVAGNSKKADRTIAPAGNYVVELRTIRGRQYQGNKTLVEIYARHAEDNGFVGATLTLFRLKDGSGKSTSQRSLLEIGKALGLSNEELATVNWAVDTDAEAGEYGDLPAAIGVAGTQEPLVIEGLKMNAVIDVETFDRKDGSVGEKNVIKALYAISE